MKENISGGVSKCPAVPLNETTVLSDFTRFHHRMTLQPEGNVPIVYMVARDFSLQKKRCKFLKSNTTNYYRRSSESRRLNS